MPPGGMCISAFLVLSKRGEPGEVLMGGSTRMPTGTTLGLSTRRGLSASHPAGMLPSSHLILFERPKGAARRILREALEIKDQRLEGPLTFADTSGTDNHWDLGFTFTGERETVSPTAVWDELKFVGVSELKRGEMVRSHLDVLAYAGKLALRWASLTS